LPAIGAGAQRISNVEPGSFFRQYLARAIPPQNALGVSLPVFHIQTEMFPGFPDGGG